MLSPFLEAAASGLFELPLADESSQAGACDVDRGLVGGQAEVFVQIADAELLHPHVGTLDLRYEKLLIPGTRGQTLVTYRARPGSDAEDRLRLLASLDGSTRTSADTVRTTADS
ncbi:hypothetical protein ABZ835_44280 [Streptomyces sp. NPDC047461]|uniref:MmyB family transcriptional regulator n=1 Tax=Streptomyces sp. NPDC047461 TaxID=3155619 RepID=UPI0033D92A8C